MSRIERNLFGLPFLLCLLGLALLAACTPGQFSQAPLNDEELNAVRALWIGSLPPLPPSASNRFADDERAARLGQQIFFDPRFSLTSTVSCATCHQPDRLFQDGRPLAQGVGTTNRRTMTLVGAAYSPWQFWDGRKDSLWAQATGPMENAVEHGSNRTYYAHLIEKFYKPEYEAIFGPLPDLSKLPEQAGPVDDPTARAAWEAMSAADQAAVSLVYANMGKAIEAYERKLLPGPARFDQYAGAVLDGNFQSAAGILSSDEVAGLRLFIGKAECTRCHNGPLFTNNDFHNTGVPAVPGLPEDLGRASGAPQALADEYNCLGVYSDASEGGCAELRFMIADGEELVRQFKPPSLRNVAERPPYMHAGQFATLEEVLDHYNRAPAAPAGHSELEPLNLTEQELAFLAAFLRTLSGPIAADERWLAAP